jgi:hypothetical protein
MWGYRRRRALTELTWNRKVLEGVLTARSATIDEMGYVTVDSCHSRWVFDTERLRFRRVPKGPGLESLMAMTQWRPYHELHLDPLSDSFFVVLNEAGTRMLRSWRHREAVCTQCGAWRTEELSAEALAH